MERPPEATDPTAAVPAAPPPWHRDPYLRGALVAGLLLRAIPAITWATDSCVRDECTYIKLAERFAQGQGMTGSAGWIWAPGYPILLGINRVLFGWPHVIKPFQIAAALGCVVLLYHLTLRATAKPDPAGGPPRGDLRAARIASWMYAISLHMAFFSFRLWSEVLYSGLLLGALLLLLRARDAATGPGRAWLRDAALVGLLGGACVLFRGVATYMLPLLMAGLLWGRLGLRRAWLQVALVGGLAVAVVGPYSAYATHKFGGFMISDRTMGQMMWLGNNDFPPMTFDYGNGSLSKRAFARARNAGRLPCGSKTDPLDRDLCQSAEGKAWIKANPVEFVRRIPLRLAQLCNPHSLLTRHLRWGAYKGMPQWMDELLVLGGALGSMLAMIGGAAGLTIRGKGAQGAVFALLLLYHCAAISALAGLTRYRVPLEPLLMVYCAALLADPAGARAALAAQRWRGPLLVLILSIGVPLVLWFLPAGWPWWRSW